MKRNEGEGMQSSEVVIDAPRARAMRKWMIVMVACVIFGGGALIVAAILALMISSAGLGVVPAALILAFGGFLLFVVAIVASFVRVDLHSTDTKAIEFAVASAGYGQVDARRVLRGDTVVTSSGHWARMRCTSDGQRSWMIVTLTPAGPQLM
ncbi:hypothetical protein QE377_003073 [Microbacterium sp. SORGH_AS 862]|nr:hypothetical protein [Microbacterium sp. SORGH_AS_0862]